MNPNQESLNQSIQQKRSNFVKEIRRQKRSEIINSRRKVLYQHHFKLFEQEKNTLPAVTYQELIKNIGTSPDQETVLNLLSAKLQSPNQNPRVIIELIFHSGKYADLINNLNKGVLMYETLFLFSLVLARPDFEKTHFLVSKGFLQILLQIFTQHIEFAARISNIVGNMCVESFDYSDMMLQSHFHLKIFEVVNELYQKFINNQTMKSPEEDLGIILWMLNMVVSSPQPALDFERQYEDVTRFCVGLLEKRILIGHAIMILYELGLKDRRMVEEASYNVINEMIEEESGMSGHFKELMLLIKLLGPGKFNYDGLFRVVEKGDAQKATIVIGIVETLINTSQMSKLQKISKDQLWWQKILSRIPHEPKHQHSIVRIIRDLRLNFRFIWRLVAEYLEDEYDKKLIKDVLMLMRAILTDTGTMRKQGNVILENIKKARVQKKLSNMAIAQNTPTHQAQLIEDILFIINNVANKLKDDHGINLDIDI